MSLGPARSCCHSMSSARGSGSTLAYNVVTDPCSCTQRGVNIFLSSNDGGSTFIDLGPCSFTSFPYWTATLTGTDFVLEHDDGTNVSQWRGYDDGSRKWFMARRSSGDIANGWPFEVCVRPDQCVTCVESNPPIICDGNHDLSIDPDLAHVTYTLTYDSEDPGVSATVTLNENDRTTTTTDFEIPIYHEWTNSGGNDVDTYYGDVTIPGGPVVPVIVEVVETLYTGPGAPPGGEIVRTPAFSVYLPTCGWQLVAAAAGTIKLGALYGTERTATVEITHNAASTIFLQSGFLGGYSLDSTSFEEFVLSGSVTVTEDETSNELELGESTWTRTQKDYLSRTEQIIEYTCTWYLVGCFTIEVKVDTFTTNYDPSTGSVTGTSSTTGTRAPLSSSYPSTPTGSNVVKTGGHLGSHSATLTYNPGFGIGGGADTIVIDWLAETTETAWWWNGT